MQLRPRAAGEQVRPRAAGEPADQREACDQKQKGGGVEGHIVLMDWVHISVRIERSRDASRPCADPMGVSTLLDTNGEGESKNGGRTNEPAPPPAGG